jgi:hypothetical protein
VFRESPAVVRGWLALATSATLVFAGAALGAAVVTAQASGAPAAAPVISEAMLLASLAPDLDPAVLDRALAALECASDPGISDARVFAVIDYARPSTERRLWIFDRTQGLLLHHALVAHGVGSGENQAVRFSNQYGTLASSLGLFRAAETYQGRNGYSMRLDGLDPGVNDRARLRTIVVHGAKYVSESYIAQHGQLGQSEGCPAVEVSKAREMIDALKDGGALYASGNDAAWLEGELRRDCRTTPIEAPIASSIEHSLRCPDSLTVDQALAGELPQEWRGFGRTAHQISAIGAAQTLRVSHHQSSASLFDGDPTLALAVDPDEPGTPETLRWTLGPSTSADGYWVLCHYSGTTLTVARPLPTGVTACESMMIEQRMAGLTCR